MRASDQQVVRGLQMFADMQDAHFRSLMNAALLQTFPPHVLLVREGELVAYKHYGFWHSMDTLRDKVLLEDLWASGKAPWRVW